MKTIATIISALLATGCGSLHTDVALFDSEGFAAYTVTKQNLPKLRETESKLAALVAKNGDEDAKATLAHVRQTRKLTQAYIGLVEADNPVADMFGRISGVSNTPTEIALEAASAFAAAKEVGAEPTSKPVEMTDEGTAKAAGNINNMKEASRVVYAPKRFWRKPINFAHGFGAYGNVDIAVRMNPDPDYSIKGFRVDSAKLIANTVSLTRQMVATVAAAYGIPTNLATGNDSSVSFDYAAELANLAGDTEGARLGRIATEAAQDAILKAISAEADNLADNAKVADAVKRIQGVYLAQKKLLVLPATN